MAEEFMSSPASHKELSQDILLDLMLLLAKKHYNQVLDYFETSQYLQERFKPVFYALLYFTNNDNYRRRPPELEEPVDDMIAQVKEMAKEDR